MLKRFWFCLAVLVLSMPGPLSAADGVWKQVRSNNGIIVYSKTTSAGQWVSAKGVGVVEAPIQKVLPYFTDIKKSQEITPRCDKKMILKTFSDKDRIEYNHIRLIWPFKDRYLIYRGRELHLGGGKILLTVEDSEGYDYQERDKIRGKIRNGRFWFKPLNSHQTHVSIETDLNAAGWLPRWILGLAARDWVYNMIGNLRRELRDSS